MPSQDRCSHVVTRPLLTCRAALRREPGAPPPWAAPRTSLPLSRAGREPRPRAHLPRASHSPVTVVHDLLDKVHNLWHVLTNPGQDVGREDLGIR